MIIKNENTILGFKKIDSFSLINLRKCLLLFGVSMTVVQQMPIIRDFYYAEFRIMIYIIFGLTTILCFKNIINNKYVKDIKIIFLLLSLMFIETMTMLVLDMNVHLVDFFEILIPTTILIIFYSVRYNRKEFYRFLLFYSIISIFMGVSLVAYYGKGIVIAPQYLGIAKNQTGPIIAAGCFVIYHFLFERRFSYKQKIFFLSGVTLGYIALLITRNRSGILALTIAMLLYYFKNIFVAINIKKIAILLLSMIVIGFVFFNKNSSVRNIIHDVFFLNYEIADIDSFSAGRYHTYIDALQFIKKYPLFGEAGAMETLKSTPHNYAINKIVRYGIMGSLFFILLYFYLIFIVIANLFKNKNIYNAAIWLLFIGMIISQFEYSYPYGPGTSQLLTWLLLGRFYKEGYENRFAKG